MIQLYNDDCLEVMKTLPDNSIDLIITDPPYTTPTVSGYGRQKIIKLSDLSIQEGYFRNIRDILEKKLKSNGRLFIFSDDRYYPILFVVFYEWLNKNLIIWDKGKIGMGNPIRKQHELLLYLNRESYEYKRSDGITHYPSILKYTKKNDNKFHPSQKPLQMIEDLIKGFSDEGETILDPFMGSGTTGLACKNLNRNFIGIELDENYFNEASKRINNDTTTNI